MKKGFSIIVVLLVLSSVSYAKRWDCVEKVLPGYFRPHCLSGSVNWNPQTGECSFSIFKTAKKPESLECSTDKRKIWIKSIECKKAVTRTYAQFFSHLFYENGKENPWALLTFRTEGGVNAYGKKFHPVIIYMEDPDYLGAHFSHRMACK